MKNISNKKNKLNLMILLLLTIVFASCSNGDGSDVTEKPTSEKVIEKADELGISEENIVETIENVKDEIKNLSNDEIVDSIKESAKFISRNDSKELALPDVEVEIKTDEEGSIIINKSQLNISSDLGVDPGIENWCISGEVIDDSSEYGEINGTVIGSTTFKNSSYCRADAIANLDGLEIDIEYYYTYGKTDVWVVTEIYGQKVEQRILSE
jgi:hypothetical protein